MTNPSVRRIGLAVALGAAIGLAAAPLAPVAALQMNETPAAGAGAGQMTEPMQGTMSEGMQGAMSESMSGADGAQMSENSGGAMAEEDSGSMSGDSMGAQGMTGVSGNTAGQMPSSGEPMGTGR